jgi:hypothetical protein
MMRKLNPWLIIGIIGVSVFGSQFGIHYGRAVWGRSDIWWTPKSMALPFNDTRRQFEIFLNDELLQNHLERGSLSATDLKGQPYHVVSDDITVRLNNWHKIKASRLHSAVFMALLLGISLMSLIVGMTQFFAGNKDNAKYLNAGDG